MKLHYLKNLAKVFRAPHDGASEAKNLRAGFKAWLKYNWSVILLAIVVSCVIYFSIRENISNTLTLSIPVEIKGDTESSLVVPNPQEVTITLRGSYTDLRLLDRSRPHIALPSSLGYDDHRSVRLKNRYIKGIANLRVLRIEPSEIAITYDKFVEESIPISYPPIIGKAFRSNAEVDFQPKTATVRGRNSLVKKLKSHEKTLKLPPIDIEGRAIGFSRKVEIISTENVKDLSVDPPSVDMTVKIVPNNVTQSFNDITVKTSLADKIALPQGFKIVPTKVVVSLIKWKDSPLKIDSDAISVFACVSTSDTLQSPDAFTTNEIPLKILAPNDSTIYELTVAPEKIKLILPPLKKTPPQQSVRTPSPSIDTARNTPTNAITVDPKANGESAKR